MIRKGAAAREQGTGCPAWPKTRMILEQLRFGGAAACADNLRLHAN